MLKSDALGHSSMHISLIRFSFSAAIVTAAQGLHPSTCVFPAPIPLVYQALSRIVIAKQ
jgi:hypothetical protein